MTLSTLSKSNSMVSVLKPLDLITNLEFVRIISLLPESNSWLESLNNIYNKTNIKYRMSKEVLEGKEPLGRKKEGIGGRLLRNDDEIWNKIKKGWCEEANVDGNPVLEIAKHVIFHEFNSINIERPEKFGGNITYENYQELESDFAEKKLHPGDLKQTVGEYLVKIISPIREKLSITDELLELIKSSN